MMRKALSVGVVVLALAAIGCANKSSGGGGSAVPTAQPVDFQKLWPKEEVAHLSPGDRKQLLDLALVGLKGNNWQHARDVLIALGKDSVPPLIDLVGNDAPSAASFSPAPPETRVKTLGEVAHDVLLEILVYRSNYRGELPARSPEAWKRWWAANGAGLQIKD
jgi:hypothetical protein